MKNFILFLLSLMLIPFAIDLSAAMNGPYKAEALAFYVVHDGGSLNIQAKLQSPGQGAVVIKILNAEEKEVFWDYAVFDKEKTVGHDFGADAPKGIYQVRVSGKNYTIDPRITPAKKYGVMPSRCFMKFSSVKQFQDVYFLIPEGSKSMSWKSYGTNLRITPQNGTSFDDKTNEADLTGKAGQVWHLSAKAGKTYDYFSFGINGIPAILCPDAETAKAINGSVEKASDGTLYAHKFQVRMHDWLKSVKQEDLKIDLVDLRTLEAQFRVEPKVKGILGPRGVFTYINYQIRNQVIDPASPKFGSVPGGNNGFAIANSLKAPFNPYAGKLEKRLLIAEFPKYLTMKENDTWSNSCSNYSGSDALAHVGDALTFYYGANSIQDTGLRNLWFDAVKRLFDRFSMFRVTCENQSSHFPFSYYAIGDVMKHDGYKKMAADFIHGMNDPALNPFMKTGYHQEAYGPDATYSGLAQCYQALYYRMSSNPEALAGCRKIHNFFSHSAVREPDGKIVCGSNFAHRTLHGWDHTQYGGGKVYLQGEVEEAAVFTSVPDIKELDYKKWLALNSVNPVAIGYAAGPFSPYLTQYCFPSKRIENPRLPFEKSESFTTNFNNEFLAVRKPGYYLFSYLTRTAGRILRHKTVENPSPVYTWCPLQGICVLWFKDYGSFIVGYNYNGNTHQMLRGDLPDGNLAFPDYMKTKTTITGERTQMAGKLFQADSVSFVRDTECLEKGIRQTLEVKFNRDIEFKSLAEQIPFFEAKKDFKLEYHVGGQWTNQPGMADAVRFCSKIVIRFDKAYLCERGPSKAGLGCLKIELGKVFKAGTSTKISYTILPE